MSIYRVKLFLALSALLVGIFLLSTTNFVSSSDSEPDVIYQAPNTHPAPDVAIIADETGLAIEVVGKAIAFQEAFGKYADELIARFPGQISSIYSDSSSGGTSLSTRGHVQFTGEVPPGIKPMKNVILTGGGHFRLRIMHAARNWQPMLWWRWDIRITPPIPMRSAM